LPPSQLTDAFSVTTAFRPVAAAHVAPEPVSTAEGIRREKNARLQTLAVGDLEIAAP
jgi:hypothetical protein